MKIKIILLGSLGLVEIFIFLYCKIVYKIIDYWLLFVNVGYGSWYCFNIRMGKVELVRCNEMVLCEM